MSAPSLSSQRVRGLDTLRAAAITAVVVYHMSWDSTNKAFRAIGAFGWTGVDLFFVLSGYLIAGQWFAKAAAGKKIPLGRFYLRRFLRTLPNYFVVFAVSWLVVIAMHGTWPAPWRYFVFAQNLGAMPVPAMSVSWSLCVEEHFYLLFPFAAAWLLARKSGRLGVTVASIVVVGSIAVRALAWWSARPDLAADPWTTFFVRIEHPTWNRLDGLAIGVSLAAVHRLLPATWARASRWSNHFGVAGVGAVVLGVGASTVGHGLSLAACSVAFSFFAVGYGLLVASAAGNRSWLARARVPFASQVAVWSYAIYLVHVPAIAIGSRIGERLGVGATGPVARVLQLWFIAGMTAALHYLVERPFLRLRDRYVRDEATPRPL